MFFFSEDVGAVLFIWSLRDFRQAPEPLKIDPCVLVVLDVLQKIVEIPRKILSKPSLHGKSCRCQCLKGRMKSPWTSYPQHCLGPRACVIFCNSGIDTCTFVVNTLKPSGGICYYIVILTGTHRAADNSLSFIGKIRRCRLCFVARLRYRQQVTSGAAIGIDRRAKRWHWVPPIDP